MNVREMCGAINSAPTFLSVVTISGMVRTICSYAEYDPETNEGSVWMYHGPYDIRKGKLFLAGKYDRENEWVNEVPFSEGMNRYVNQLLTKYDFTAPGMLPPCAKSVWLKKLSVITGRGSFSGEELEPLIERMRKVEKEIGEDGR